MLFWCEIVHDTLGANEEALQLSDGTDALHTQVRGFFITQSLIHIAVSARCPPEVATYPCISIYIHTSISIYIHTHSFWVKDSWLTLALSSRSVIFCPPSVIFLLLQLSSWPTVFGLLGNILPSAHSHRKQLLYWYKSSFLVQKYLDAPSIRMTAYSAVNRGRLLCSEGMTGAAAARGQALLLSYRAYTTESRKPGLPGGDYRDLPYGETIETCPTETCHSSLVPAALLPLLSALGAQLV